jgi:integrase
MATKRANGEGTIAVRPDGRWEARFTYTDTVTGRVQRHSVYGKTQREARDNRTARQARLAAGAPARDSTVTLGAFVSVWTATTLRASSRKESTKYTYGGLATKHLAGEGIGEIMLAKLRPTDVEALILKMRDGGLSPSTVRQTFTILRTVLDTAVRDGYLANNFVTSMKRPSVPHGEARWLTAPEVARLFVELEGSRYAPIMRLLVMTGLRRGEGLALRWQDVDLFDNVLRVQGTLARVGGSLTVTEPKTATSRRTVRMSAALVELLRAQRETQNAERVAAADLWTETGLVFTTETGSPVEPRNALRALTVAAGRAGLADVGVHTLRHTAASLMLAAKVPLKEVSVMLGHSSVSITGDIYGHVTPEGQQTAADVLADALAN